MSYIHVLSHEQSQQLDVAMRRRQVTKEEGRKNDAQGKRKIKSTTMVCFVVDSSFAAANKDTASNCLRQVTAYIDGPLRSYQAEHISIDPLGTYVK